MIDPHLGVGVIEMTPFVTRIVFTTVKLSLPEV